MRKKKGFWKLGELAHTWGLSEDVVTEALAYGDLEKARRGFSEGATNLSVRNFIYRMIMNGDIEVSTDIEHMESVEGFLTVSNPRGIHIGPSLEIADIVRCYPKTKVELWLDGKLANAHKAIEILKLEAKCGDEIELICQGWGAAFLFNEIDALFKSKFKVFYEKMNSPNEKA